MSDSNGAAVRHAVSTITIEGDTLRQKFVNGHEIVVSYAQLPESVRAVAALNGLAASLRNSYNTVRDDVAASAKVAQERAAAILGGKWPVREPGAGVSASALDHAITARAQFRGMDATKVRSVVETFTEEQQDAFILQVKRDPNTAPIYAALRSKRAQKVKGAVDLTAAGI